MKPIPVALECSALCNLQPTGISVYTSTILKHLEENPSFVTPFPFYKGKFFKKRPFYYNAVHPAKSYLHRSFADLGDCKLTHSTDNKFLYSRKRKNIVTIHDVAIFLKENEIPSYTDDRFRQKVKQLNLEVAQRADRIITVSQKTKDDFCRLFNASPDRVTVVHPGYTTTPFQGSNNGREVLTHLNLPERGYFLFVGAVSIRKNILNLLHAYKQSGLYKQWPLVLAGPSSMGIEQIVQLKKELGLEEYVRLTGFLSDDSLQALYHHAGAFVFPTFYEGFGIPLLEAMSHGLPVLTSTTGAAPEVCGELATLVNPFSVEEIAAGLKTLTTQPADSLLLKQHANSFSWQKTAMETIKVYQSVL